MDLLDFSKLEDLRELEAFTPGFLLQVLQQFQVNFENYYAVLKLHNSLDY